MEPLYVAQPGGMRLFNAVLAVLILSSLIGAMALLVFVNVTSAAITIASMGLLVLFIYFILPRRYEIWPERLRIVFPGWNWNIDYAGIASVRAGLWYEAYGFWGMRFATAPSQTVTILRHNANLLTHPNLVISPEDRETILRRLERAMRA